MPKHKSKQDGSKLPEYTHSHDGKDKNFCRNCHRKILVMAFRGTGVCSVDCQRVLGIEPKNPYEGRTA